MVSTKNKKPNENEMKLKLIHRAHTVARVENLCFVVGSEGKYKC